MKKGILLFLLSAAIIFIFCLLGCAPKPNNDGNENIQPQTVTFTFLVDEELFMTITCDRGDPCTYVKSEKPGYEFYGWYKDRNFDKKWDFEKELAEEDLTLYGYHKPINYSITFIADGQTVTVEQYTVENKSVSAPKVPDKPYYIGKWESFEPIIGDITVNAIYTPIEYTVEYKADGKTVGSKNYTVENKNITPPAVPELKGYTGEWEQKELTSGDVTINAIYTLIKYTAEFIVDGVTVYKDYFSIEDMHVEEPVAALPHQDGYTADWESYRLSLENMRIEAVYIPIEYIAEFFADDIKIFSAPFTIENESLPEPKIPEKKGYSAEWETYEISAQNIRINAIFTPVTYYAIFLCDGVEIASIPFNVENMRITEPAPVFKENFTSKWEDYTLTCSNIKINAIYTEIVQDKFTYESNASDTLTVTGYTGNDSSPIIPFEHSGKKITAIATGAFAYGKFASITIPDNITEIGEQAFAHSELKSVKLSDNVKILKNVFYDCKQLENVELGRGLETICEHAFFNCETLNKITIPSSVAEIQPEAFTGCKSLDEVIFESTENWSVYNENGDFIRELASESLNDSATAAEYLKRIFIGRLWKRTQ
ncbi:MAG TPA: hypothetical protein DD415_03860 [Clostridiales bacterium]|nr:hypothetical protein [Clostridiales bacterium]